MIKALQRGLAVLFVFSAMLMPMLVAAVRSGSVRAQQVTHSDRMLHIKFASDADVTVQNGWFVSAANVDLSHTNLLLPPQIAVAKTKLFDPENHELHQQRAALQMKHKRPVPNLNNYFRVELAAGHEMAEVLADLRARPEVADAYAEPLHLPPPLSPNLTLLQLHNDYAPRGMGVDGAGTFVGARGDRVTVADIEYSWNIDHEDVSDARAPGAFLANGSYSDPAHNDNHGTAVAGLLNADANGYGVTGIVPNARLRLINAFNLERGWDVANAVLLAAQTLEPGDVLLIEQQAWGPYGRGFLPVEWVPAVYDAIRYATMSGIHVVEAGGNGGENLDDSLLGPVFPMGKPDSGAIIVGAGSACNGTAAHGRLPYSNYGSRINVQGHGECVTTAGYGLINYEAGKNAWYTNNFSGTSSAAAMVAGAVAAVSSSYEAQYGVPLSPQAMRDLLLMYGSPQDTSLMPGRIGPLPDMIAMLSAISKDTTRPTTPEHLRVLMHRYNVAAVFWKPSVDDRPGVLYRVYRNNTLIATTPYPYFLDYALSRKTRYTYMVQAIDAVGNTSGYSNTRTVRSY